MNSSVPCPLDWDEFNCERVLITDTNRKRPAELGWCHWLNDVDCLVMLDGANRSFTTSRWHISRFNITPLGNMIVQVGVSGGGVYKANLGYLYKMAENLFEAAPNNPAKARYTFEDWETACLHLFNIAEGRQ